MIASSPCSRVPHTFVGAKANTAVSWFKPENAEDSSDVESDAGTSVSVKEICHITTPKKCCVTYRKCKKEKDLSTDAGKKKFLEKLAKVKAGGKKQKNLPAFIDATNIKTVLTKDGEIILKGVEIDIPDLAADLKAMHKAEIDQIKNSNCNIKEVISNSMRITTFIAIFLAVFIIISGLIYLIYRAFFASAE